MTTHKRTRQFLFFVLALGISLNSFGWGSVGHKLVAKIAYSQLRPSVKDSLALYLRGATIEEASVWMDEIKADKSYDFQKPWHYINIDKGTEYHDGDTGNIVWEINRIIPELQNRQNYSREKIEIDLKILIHLLGDLHQPLHVGYAVDQGGNTIKIFYAATPSNLHRVWDTDIIHDGVLGKPLDWSKLDQFTPQELADIKRYDVVAWLNESRAKLDTVYNFKGDNLTQKYVDKNASIVEHQLLVGGLRLGAILNSIFAKK